MRESLDQEFDEVSKQVGYMRKWLKVQRELGSFKGRNKEEVETILAVITAADRNMNRLYQLKREVLPLLATKDEKKIDQVFGRLFRRMIKVGQAWAYLGEHIMWKYPPVTMGKVTRKELEQDAVLETEYDPEDYSS